MRLRVCCRKFGKYLEENLRPQWRQNYVDYKLLKDLIKASLAELEGDDNARHSFSPRTTSLTVQRQSRGRKTSEEEFFEILEQQARALSQPILSALNCLALRDTLLKENNLNIMTMKDLLIERHLAEG